AEVVGMLHPEALSDRRSNEYQFGVAACPWLEAATMQTVHHLDIKQMEESIQSWWKANQDKDIDNWFVQGVERDLSLLRSDDGWVRNMAFRFLQDLTGMDFGFHGGVFETQATDQWDQWWKANRHRRRGELLLDSLRNTSINDSTRYSTLAM